MSSYYREHVTYPNVAAGPYPADLIAELERNAASHAGLKDVHEVITDEKSSGDYVPAHNLGKA